MVQKKKARMARRGALVMYQDTQGRSDHIHVEPKTPIHVTLRRYLLKSIPEKSNYQQKRNYSEQLPVYTDSCSVRL